MGRFCLQESSMALCKLGLSSFGFALSQESKEKATFKCELVTQLLVQQDMNSFLLCLALAGQTVNSLVPSNLEKGWTYAQDFKSMAVLVMQNEKVIFERYANGGSKERGQALASGSKSFCGTVAAAAVQDGLLKYDELVSDTFPEWKKDPLKAKITVRQLLNLTSGLDPGKSGTKDERSGWEDAKSSKMTGKPGEQFAYGPNPFNTFGLLMEMKLKTKSWEDYLNSRILKPLGISLKYVGRCADGRPQLAGGAWMTPSDWLTFGQFILQDGKWKGKQIIRKDLLDELYKPTKANPSYGMSWWLNKDAESSLVGRNVEPGLGDGFRMAAGAGKQRLYILPTQNAVVLRMGKVVDRARGWSDNAFLGAILGQAVPDQRKRPRARGELRKSMFDPR